jgi:hydrogenase maturation protein HypF
LIRRRLRVAGIVQGVGFRPFVYRLALRHSLSGWVGNDAAGVILEAEGEPAALEAFGRDLVAQAPPLALVTSLTAEELPPLGGAGFAIRESSRGEAMATLISPDIATCDDCLAEMGDPADRRHRYPFINCTNCGPRYSIIRDIPYDRPRTTMAPFAMCPDCSREYHDPADRRFHAQPNACPVCGPRLSLLLADGTPAAPDLDPLAETIRLLRRGGIAAVKGLGGFHLAVDAADQGAVAELRRRKHREEKPMAVMVADLPAARRLVLLSPREEDELASPRRPILLARRRGRGGVADAVAPGNDFLGVMLPYAPLHHLLLREGGFAALVMTSANLSEEPICIANDEAVARLAGIADLFLVHDRDIHLPVDDSVVRVAAGDTRPVRRSRGFAPAPILLGRSHRPVLGLGAELKNTVCLLKGETAFLSQHVGDLANLEAYGFFRRTLDHLERILECRAGLLAHDLHPGYLSTRFALEQGDRPAEGVQHHHAHAAACLAEHGLAGPALAVTFDGTGYGEDGTVWGGEFLVADLAGYRRAGHLSPVLLPGGDAAVREPWRLALAHLFLLDEGDPLRLAPSLRERLEPVAVEVVGTMLRRRLNAIPTTSAGRLFDAVASLAGVRDRVSYEGQAAMELEAAGHGRRADRIYPFRLVGEGGVTVADTRPLIGAVAEDVARGEGTAAVSARFHATVARLILSVLERLREETGLGTVVLSGGVFQNLTLLEQTLDALAGGGFDVRAHRLLPTNDGGIALGQAVAAHARRHG